MEIEIETRTVKENASSIPVFLSLRYLLFVLISISRGLLVIVIALRYAQGFKYGLSWASRTPSGPKLLPKVEFQSGPFSIRLLLMKLYSVFTIGTRDQSNYYSITTPHNYGRGRRRAFSKKRITYLRMRKRKKRQLNFEDGKSTAIMLRENHTDWLLVKRESQEFSI